MRKIMETVQAAEVAREAHEAFKQAKEFIITLRIMEAICFWVSFATVWTGLLQIVFMSSRGCKPYYSFWHVAFIVMCCVTTVHIVNALARTKGTDIFWGLYLAVGYHMIRMMMQDGNHERRVSRNAYSYDYIILLQEYVVRKPKRQQDAHDELQLLFPFIYVVHVIMERRKGRV